MHRAVSAFGDDKDLVVEVCLAHADPTDEEAEALAVGMWLYIARLGLRAMRADCTPNTPNDSRA